MILREIVLSGAPPSNSSPSISEMSSSFVSTSSAQSLEYDSAWPVKRPDLDDFGRPKKGTRALSGTVNDGEKPRVGKRASKDILPQYKARRTRTREKATPRIHPLLTLSKKQLMNSMTISHLSSWTLKIPFHHLDVDRRRRSFRSKCKSIQRSSMRNERNWQSAERSGEWIC
jgi:hypothetical protein